MYNGKFRLTGPRTGQTVTLRHIHFVDGVASIDVAAPGDLVGIGKLLALYYGAERIVDGEGDIHQDSEQDSQAGIVQSLVRTDGVEADSDPDGRQRAEQGASVGATKLADGVGHKNSLMDEKLRSAVMALNPANDEHWTAAGLPKIDAVANILGAGSVLRSDIARAAAGVTRESVRG